MTAPRNADPFRWCFSTLGCPELSLAEACALATDFHIPALELRSLGGTVDLPKLFAEGGWTAQRVCHLASQTGVRLVVAGSSFKLASSVDAERVPFLDYCAWADSLGIPFVRAFGGGTWGQALAEPDFAAAVWNVEWWRAEKRARGWRIEMLMETHDAFSASAPCLELNRRLDQPIRLIWDSHHTWRLGGESPADSWQQLGHWVCHVHVKDSVDRPSARHPFTYDLPGAGQMPLGKVLTVLRENKFAGCVSLEWEKLWHPYLPPLREALLRVQTQPWFAAPAHELQAIGVC